MLGQQCLARRNNRALDHLRAFYQQPIGVIIDYYSNFSFIYSGDEFPVHIFTLRTQSFQSAIRETQKGFRPRLTYLRTSPRTAARAAIPITNVVLFFMIPSKVSL